jgi:hypothetical protein
MADHLQQLLDLLEESRVKDRLCQFDVTEMTRTFRHVLIARSALVLSVDGSESRVIQTLIPRLHLALVHGLRIQDVHNTHILDLFR